MMWPAHLSGVDLENPQQRLQGSRCARETALARVYPSGPQTFVAKVHGRPAQCAAMPPSLPATSKSHVQGKV